MVRISERQRNNVSAPVQPAGQIVTTLEPMEVKMSGKTSKVLMIAIAVSVLAIPMASTYSNAMEIRVNQVTSTVSNGSGEITGGLFGSLVDKVLQGIKDQKSSEKRNSRPITPA
jgi:hypothetical protein